MKPKTMLALFCGFVMRIVMLQNTQTAVIHILFWQIVHPQFLPIVQDLLASPLIHAET